MKPPSEIARDHFERLARLWNQLDPSSLDRIGEELLRAYRSDATIYILGNGGSASTASHISCDWSKSTITENHRRLRAVSLTDNMAWFSAVANDIGFEAVFVEQLRNILRPEDLLLAISASGNSTNVLRAVEFAKGVGVTTIAFTGMSGGALKQSADLVLHLPGGDYGTLEDAHLILNHVLVEFLRGEIAVSAP